MVVSGVWCVVVVVDEDQDERSSEGTSNSKGEHLNYSNLVKAFRCRHVSLYYSVATPVHFGLQYMHIFSSARPLFKVVTVNTPVHTNLRA